MSVKESYAGKINRKLNKKLRVIAVAAGREPADLVLKNATYVNVFSNELCHGDIAVAEDGQVKGDVLLAIAGIMSDDSLVNVNRDLEAAKAAAYGLGVSEGIDPFMTLSFMALPVIPSLRITTRGVFDVNSQRYV